MIDLFKIILGKGEGMPSPFVFPFAILFLISILPAQYGIADWLHPVINISMPNDTGSYLQIVNNSHLGIISDNDALNISENTYGINYVKQFQRNRITIKYKQYQSRTQLDQPDYVFNVMKNYHEFLFGYVIDRKNISANVELKKKSQIQGIFPFLLLTAKLQPWLACSYGKSIDQVPLDLILNYYDFEYELNNINTINDMHYYGFSIINKKYQIDYILLKNSYGINVNDTLHQRIEFDNGIKNKLYFKGTLFITNKDEISWIYKKSSQEMGLKLKNVSDKTFLKIDNFSNNNDVISVKYTFHYSKYAIHIQYMKKDMDLYLDTRIWPSRMNLTDLFGSKIENLDYGNIEQEIVSIKLEPSNVKTIFSTIKISWLKDKYDMGYNTTGKLLWFIPVFTDNQNLDIIGKDAININMGISLKHGNWMISTNFSQHIPVNIRKRNKSETEGGTEASVEISGYPDLTSIVHDIESELSVGNYYGGGLFHLSLIRYID